jgi:hypothetical protein
MHLIEVTPAPCLICGAGNTPDGSRSNRQFIDLERDTNWNDPAIICEDCALSIGGLVGMVSPDEIRRLKRELKEIRQEVHRRAADLDELRRRSRKLGIEFVGVGE